MYRSEVNADRARYRSEDDAVDGDWPTRSDLVGPRYTPILPPEVETDDCSKRRDARKTDGKTQ